MSYAMLARENLAGVSSKQKARGSSGLRIGEPNDAFEQEADRAADEIMAGTTKREWSLSKISIGVPLQRECACCGSGHEGTHEECKEKKTLRRKGPGLTQNGMAPPIVHEVLDSPGQPMDKAALTFFERAFVRDFSHVRIHCDDKAPESAKSVGAHAFSVGKHIVFDAGQYAPGSKPGQHLLAHELAHVVQQSSTPVLRRQPKQEGAGSSKIGPLVQKFIRGEATEQEKEIVRKQLLTDQLTPEEVDALKQYVARQIANAVVLGQPGQVNISVGGPLSSVHTFFKVKLKLRLSGAAKTLVGGLAGTIETFAEVNADKDSKKVTVRISPPPGDTMLAELTRAKAFPNGELTFELGETFLKALNMISLQGELTLILTGKKEAQASGLVISTPDIPEDVELEATLSQSGQKPELAPATGAPARPPVRAFVTGGVTHDPKQTGAATTVGVDFPLGNDTKDPLKYAGLGLRVGADTGGGARAGGAGFVGLNLNPITLQLAFEAGIARVPAGQTPAGSGAQAAGYFGAEASVGVHVSKRVEVMALASILGDLGNRDSSSASVQVGAGFTF